MGLDTKLICCKVCVGEGATLVFILIDYESSDKIAFISNMMQLRQILAWGIVCTGYLVFAEYRYFN